MTRDFEIKVWGEVDHTLIHVCLNNEIVIFPYLIIFISHLPLQYDSSIALKKDANICVDVRNPLSDEIREKVVIDPSELIEDENSKEPPYHFGLTWEGSKKKSVMTVLDVDGVKSALKKSGKKGKKAKSDANDPRIPRPFTANDKSFVPILALECRGIEPIAFYPMGGEFIIESEAGAVFDGDDVDFSEGDWADYDTENDISVSAYEFKSKFESI